ncbi:BPH1 [Sanghuangporus vaninii]
MFGRLLTPLVTPLVARFDHSPRPESEFGNHSELEDASAEDFARDVKIELMRNSVESLKATETLVDKIEVMDEIHRIMLEEPATKDVFRELDGYLLMVTVLTTLQPIPEQEHSGDGRVEECERLVFMVLSESFNERPENSQYFEKRVGYSPLGEALVPLLLDAKSIDSLFGLLLSAAHANFTLSNIFSILRLRDELDLTNYRSMLARVKNAQFYALSFSLLPKLPPGDKIFPRALIALTEICVSMNHRNKVLLSSTHLFKIAFDQFLEGFLPSTKLLRKLLDVGAGTEQVRLLFQRAIKKDGALNGDVLEILRSGMKTKWPKHFSLEDAASVRFEEQNVRGLPSTGLTFMVWLYIERFPSTTSQAIFTVESKSRVLLRLSLRPNGHLELSGSENGEATILDQAKVSKSRWTHLVLIHHPHRASSPTIRVFIDGSLVSTKQQLYPRADSTAQTISYVIGDSRDTPSPDMSWCFASCYLLSLPLGDDAPHVIQHLGPQYSGHFQTKDLFQFLTYEASTSLNILLSSIADQRGIAARNRGDGRVVSSAGSSMLRILKDGIGVTEESFVFSVSASGYRYGEADVNGGFNPVYVRNGFSSQQALANRGHLAIAGDVVPVLTESLDTALWRIGGAAAALRIVELATTSHELSRALGIFTDSARNSWQMSEDMEHISAFENLVRILQNKSRLINLTAFETLFEFLGLNFRNPDRSVIVNAVAYRAIALDFSLWASAKDEIQRMHLDHFSTLLNISKFRSFNAKQRIGKFGVVRKMLFALQTNWYTTDMAMNLVSALKFVAQACFSADGAIKPVVSFLAANLHEDNSQASSPRSMASQIDRSHTRNKAEQLLSALVSILSVGRERPTPAIAGHVLAIVGIAMRASSSFARKFELVGGWMALRLTLPDIWNDSIQQSVFDVLFGSVCTTGEEQGVLGDVGVVCPNIMPSILAALEKGLTIVAKDYLDEETTIAEAHVESLLERLIDLQSSSRAFRQLFKSQQTTATFIGAYATFVDEGRVVRANRRNYTRILEKLNHFAMSLTLDDAVSSSQKREIRTTFGDAETILVTQPFDIPMSAVAGERRAPHNNKKSQAAHASIHMLSEKAYQKTAGKIRDWRKEIISNERKCFRRTARDIREACKHAERDHEWRDTLLGDRGLWTIENAVHIWMLDETEGPCRVRKKLRPKFEVPTSLVSGDETRAVIQPDSDAQSFVQVDLVVPPWAEGYELDANDEQWIDEFSEDKLRRVRHELENGDVIDAVFTVSRIVGVDSSPGLLLLGHSHVYMLDGLVENNDGEVVEASEAPTNLLTVPGSVLELDGKQGAQKWSYNQVASFSRRTCLFRDVALEVYFKDNRSLLIVFPNWKRRQDACDRLTASVAAQRIPASRSPLILHRSPLLARTAPKFMTGLRDELATALRKWQAREISNFTYISILNQTSGRTPCDATQYPVFPWVLADYSSDALDLSSPSTFRDLSRPMGALSESRREAARQRYENLKSVGETPFHYGTHFSSSMIVCHFLIRLEPYTHMFKTLQGGDWDLPDRLFVDISRAYYSASQDLRGDVRELIPEFFTCPEFLQNIANMDFGVQQNTGEKIHDVKLPPWAKGDPFLFITEHRKALESDFVSEHLPSWIDLIWGYKQRDPESLNVYHPYSYEGSIDLDRITDNLERQATVGIIHNFGQTPRKLFNTPHPSRIMQGTTTLPLGTSYGAIEDAQLLVQSSRPVAEITELVASLSIDMISERVIPCPHGFTCVPSFPHEQLAWGFVDQSIKLLVDKKVVQVRESVSCTCLAFVDSDRFISGSDDYMVRFWRLDRKEGRTSMSKTHILRAHTATVLCVAASRSWSCVASGSDDGTVVIWDLNRATYMRSISHKCTSDEGEKLPGVSLVAINESTGYIASCSESKLCLHTINACPIATIDLMCVDPADGRITSLAFHEREYSRLGILATGSESGAIVLRTWSAADTPKGEKAQWKFFTLRKLWCREAFDGTRSKVSSVQFIGETLYHGDADGRVFTWDLPE